MSSHSFSFLATSCIKSGYSKALQQSRRGASFLALLCFALLWMGLCFFDIPSSQRTTFVRAQDDRVLPFLRFERKLSIESFAARFSLWQPTWTAISLADHSNMNSVQEKVTEFLCDETTLTIVSSTENLQEDVCSELFAGRRLQQLENQIQRHAESQWTEETIWTGETIITQGIDIEVLVHNEEDITWSTWSLSFYVVQVGEEFVDGNSWEQFNATETNLLNGAIAVLESTVQASLDASIESGAMDERFEGVGAIVSVVGDEVSTFRKYGRRYKKRLFPNARTIRIIGVSTITFIILCGFILRLAHDCPRNHELYGNHDDETRRCTKNVRVGILEMHDIPESALTPNTTESSAYSYSEKMASCGQYSASNEAGGSAGGCSELRTSSFDSEMLMFNRTALPSLPELDAEIGAMNAGEHLSFNRNVVSSCGSHKLIVSDLDLELVDFDWGCTSIFSDFVD